MPNAKCCSQTECIVSVVRWDEHLKCPKKVTYSGCLANPLRTSENFLLKKYELIFETHVQGTSELRRLISTTVKQGEGWSWPRVGWSICLRLKLGTHCPCPRPVNTGVKNDTRVHGPCWPMVTSVSITARERTGVIIGDTRVHLTPVFKGRGQTRPVDTGSVYRANYVAVSRI